MIKSVFIGLLLGIVGIAAAQTPPKKTFQYKTQSALRVKDVADAPVVEFETVKGKNLVFFYEWQSARNPQIADGESTHILYFEIPARTRNITASGKKELEKYNTVRCRMCFCVEGGCRKPSEGELTVTRLKGKKYEVTYKDNPEDRDYFIQEIFTTKQTVK
ncbi:MAG: hypothetical protein MH137_00640 [Flavobacteriales bacterium]|nr:hypothetical protein [Flavobacteriales bacterium]